MILALASVIKSSVIMFLTNAPDGPGRRRPDPLRNAESQTSGVKPNLNMVSHLISHKLTCLACERKVQPCQKTNKQKF
jgi:hypothetical protein